MNQYNYWIRIVFIFALIFSFQNGFAISGDDPCNSIVINSTKFGSVLSFDLNGLSDSGFAPPSCGDYQGTDLWLEVTPLGTSITIETIAGSIQDLAFEVYSNACSGGTAYHYGCFQDFQCGAEPMPKATISDLIPNEKYYIRLWKEGGGSGTFDIIIVDSKTQPYVVIQDASVVNLGTIENCIELTKAENYQRGCAWYPTKIDFSLAFDLQFNLFFGFLDGDGADGITLVFQPHNTSLCGLVGGGLGAGGIPDSWIIEYDTWYNGQYNDIQDDHVAIDMNGNLKNAVVGPKSLGNIEDGNIHTTRLVWEPKTQLFQVYFDGNLQLDVTFDIVNNVFGGESKVFWGLTSSTGGAINNQIFCFKNLVIKNSTSYEVDALETICKGTSIMLGGQSQTEPGTYTDLFNASNGCDSLVHTTLEVVEVAADAPLEYTLGCQPLEIDASNSIVTAGTAFKWTTSDGNIVDGADGLVLTVDAPGTYTLNMIDLASGCNDGIKVKVLPTPELIADAGTDNMITCLNTELILDADQSTSGNDITYEWTTTNGNILEGVNSPTPKVNAAGTYVLSVANSVTGCIETDTVLIDVDDNLPEVALVADQIITCDHPTVKISKSVQNISNNTDLTWSLPNNASIIDETPDYIEINTPGTYLLDVVNNDNGCKGLASVEIVENTDLPMIDVLQFDTINCYHEEVNLQLAVTAAADYMVNWSSNNGNFNPIDKENILVTKKGVFHAIVENLENGCTDSVDIEVLADLEKPVVDAGTPQKLVCTQTDLILDGTTNITDFDVIWTTNNGFIDLGEHTLTPKITQGGDYKIQVTNLKNGCKSEDFVTIDQDENIPEIEYLPVDTLTCDHESVLIDARQSSHDNIYDFVWKADNNQVIDHANSLQPEISAPGVYTLVITNTDNNCQKSKDIVVEQNIEKPIVDLGAYPILDCDTKQIELGGNGISVGNDFYYNWELENGTIPSPNISHPKVNTPGLYSLTITDARNGCTESSSVEILQNIKLPEMKMAEPDNLTCKNEAIELNADGSDFGPDFSINWFTQNGNIVKYNDDLHPVVDKKGAYTMTSKNLTTSCEDSMTMVVEEYKDKPNIEISGTYELTCEQRTFTLDGINHSNGDFQFEWTTSDGHIKNGADNLNPVVDQKGTYILKVTNRETGCESTASVAVVANSVPPVADAGPDIVIDCSDLTGTGELDGSMSTLGLDYLWTTTDGHFLTRTDSIKVEVDSAGTYILTVTDPNNACSSMDTVVVTTDFNFPVAKVKTVGTLNCRDTIVQIDLTDDSSMGSNFSYKWTTFGSEGHFVSGQNTSSTVVDEPGFYSITVKNISNTCESSVGVEVKIDTVLPILVLGNPDKLNCIITQVSLVSDGSKSGNPQNSIDFLWSTNDGFILSDTTDANIDVNAPGTYKLSLIDIENHCETVDSLLVLQDTISPMADAGMDTLVNCANPEIVLQGLGSTGAKFSYNWNTTGGNIKSGSTSLNPVVDKDGTYSLVVSNSENGCTNSAMVQVASDMVIPSILIPTPDVLTCIDTVVDITTTISDMGANGTIQWTPSNGGNIITDTDIPNIMVNSAGNYTIVVSNPDNGCSKSEEITVAENKENPNISIGEPATINCENLTVTIDGKIMGNCNNCDIKWNTINGTIDSGDQALNPIVSDEGYYYLNVENKENGCRSVDSVFINKNVQPPTAADFNVENPLCFGDKGVISVLSVTDGLAPYTYSLNNVDFTNLSTVINDLNKGKYDLYIKDANGCVFQTQFDVVEPNPIELTVPEEIVLKYNAAGQVSVITNVPTDEIASIEWTPSEGLSCDTCLNPTVTALENGIYNVTLINSNGCKISGSFRLIIDFELEVYIPNVITPKNGDGINDMFYVFAQDGVKEILGMNIYDRWGNQVFSRSNFQPNNPSLGWDGRFNGKQLQSGVYAYWIQIQLYNGKKVLYEGDVTILN